MVLRRLFASFFVAASILTAGAVLFPQPVHAATREECTGNASITVLPKWYKYLNPRWGDPDGPPPNGPQGPTCILDGATFPGAIPAILLAVFEILLRVAGIVSVLFIVYGGFQYLITTGEPDKAKNARTTIINALVGLMIAMFATVIVNLVGRNIG
ncbi:MAG TPA: hypothetical protein VK674_05985 [Candidatus Limnocylindria bacterium]|nr:hypothetical protein [Candidatus Limnocylindria bacterium]